MKEVVLTYFTGTGNTKLIATQIFEELRNSGINVTMIESEDLEAFRNVDFSNKVLVVGFPVYLFRAPKIINNMINSLPISQQSVPACIFSTKAWASGNSIRIVAKELYRKGFITIDSTSFVCPSNGWITLLDKNNILYRLTRFEKGLSKKISRFSGQIKSICRSDKNPKQRFFPNNLLLELGRVVGRKIEDRLFVDLQIDYDKCINCKKCVAKCPVDKFNFDDNKVLIKDSVKCMQCLRCISSCPVQCINFGEKTIGKKRYDKKTMMEYYDKIKSHE